MGQFDYISWSVRSVNFFQQILLSQVPSSDIFCYWLIRWRSSYVAIKEVKRQTGGSVWSQSSMQTCFLAFCAAIGFCNQNSVLLYLCLVTCWQPDKAPCLKTNNRQLAYNTFQTFCDPPNSKWYILVMWGWWICKWPTESSSSGDHMCGAATSGTGAGTGTGTCAGTSCTYWLGGGWAMAHGTPSLKLVLTSWC